jgi:hypothetical protein
MGMLPAGPGSVNLAAVIPPYASEAIFSSVCHADTPVLLAYIEHMPGRRRLLQETESG